MPRFFLVKGKAGIYYGEKLVVVIEEGSYFGEIGCIMGGIRRAGVKALTTCELQALSRRNLNTLLGEYPEVGDELKQVARDRASKAKHGTESTNVPDSSGPSKLNITAAPPTLIATPPPPAGINEDARYLALVDAEVSRIVSTLSAKIRADIGIAPRTSNVQREGITYESTKFIST
jgi:CRP-like cAMP-binding protein